MRFNPQCFGKTSQRSDRRVSRSAFKVADIAAFHFRIQCQLLLGQASQLPVFPDIRAKDFNHIHRLMCGRKLGLASVY